MQFGSKREENYKVQDTRYPAFGGTPQRAGQKRDNNQFLNNQTFGYCAFECWLFFVSCYLVTWLFLRYYFN